MPVDALSYVKYGNNVWDRRPSRISPCGEVLDGHTSRMQFYDNNECLVECLVVDVTVCRCSNRVLHVVPEANSNRTRHNSTRMVSSRIRSHTDRYYLGLGPATMCSRKAVSDSVAHHCSACDPKNAA